MTGNRINYIDAMRGLAMLLVVVGHVFIFGIHDESNSSSNNKQDTI